MSHTKIYLYTIIILSTLASCQSRESDHVQEYHRVVVDASVYRGLMQMLGVGDRCIDFSDQLQPNIEQIAASNPDLLMLSAYEGADLSRYERLGVRIVECRDFLESSPLARAAWMKNYGRLWGVAAKADSLYSVVEKNYNSIKVSTPLPMGEVVVPESIEYRFQTAAAQCSNSSRPESQKNLDKHKGGPLGLGERIPLSLGENPNSPPLGGGVGGEVFLFDLLYGNQWYQPVPNSTMGRLVHDAGGSVISTSTQQGGSVSYNVEQMLSLAHDADVWIIRYGGPSPLTLAELGALNPAYRQFKAYKTGRVFVSYVSTNNYYDESPWRPDYLLQDIISILHSQTENLRYFEKIK